MPRRWASRRSRLHETERAANPAVPNVAATLSSHVPEARSRRWPRVTHRDRARATVLRMSVAPPRQRPSRRATDARSASPIVNRQPQPPQIRPPAPPRSHCPASRHMSPGTCPAGLASAHAPARTALPPDTCLPGHVMRGRASARAPARTARPPDTCPPGHVMRSLASAHASARPARPSHVPRDIFRPASPLPGPARATQPAHGSRVIFCGASSLPRPRSRFPVPFTCLSGHVTRSLASAMPRSRFPVTAPCPFGTSSARPRLRPRNVCATLATDAAGSAAGAPGSPA
ncbi:hypothetical protein NAEX_04965 [Nannocystis exedens]|nr:hypothetical protein NAEX_04965 [Nannocystis exedens]